MSEVSTIHLRALSGEPLTNTSIRRIVRSTAHAIAERVGIRLIELSMESDRVTATLESSRLAAIGFAAELRRVTNRWHEGRTGESTLWGEVREEGDDWLGDLPTFEEDES